MTRQIGRSPVSRTPGVPALLLVLTAVFLLPSPPALAQDGSILFFSDVTVDTALGVDTAMQIDNLSIQTRSVSCSWANRNSHCSNYFEVCTADTDCLPPGTCIPYCMLADFSLLMGGLSSLSWSADQGLFGSIPPVSEDPFVGDLVCIETDAEGAPTGSNSLRGSGQHIGPGTGFSGDAIHIQGIDVDGDTTLQLDGNEYGYCPTIIPEDRIENCWSDIWWYTFSCAEPPFNPDHFKCYKAKDLKNPKFVPTTVTLADQFGVNDGPFEVKKPFLMCNPTDKNGEGISNSDDHLACYKIKGPKLDKNDRPHVEVVNQLGTVQLEAKKPFLLCVPSAKTVLP